MQRGLTFAPLFGEAFEQRLSDEQKSQLPDTMALLDERHQLHVKSDAVVEIGIRLGGFWKPLAKIYRCIPRSWRDRLYDFIGRNRYRWFGKTQQSCPVMQPELRKRFV